MSTSGAVAAYASSIVAAVADARGKAGTSAPAGTRCVTPRGDGIRARVHYGQPERPPYDSRLDLADHSERHGFVPPDIVRQRKLRAE